MARSITFALNSARINYYVYQDPSDIDYCDFLLFTFPTYCRHLFRHLLPRTVFDLPFLKVSTLLRSLFTSNGQILTTSRYLRLTATAEFSYTFLYILVASCSVHEEQLNRNGFNLTAPKCHSGYRVLLLLLHDIYSTPTSFLP